MAQNKTEYAFVQREVDDFSCIKITKGPYEGVIYTYGQVKFAENEVAGRLPLKFTYNVQRNINDVDTESEEFRQAIGDILIEVMEKQLSEKQKYIAKQTAPFDKITGSDFTKIKKKKRNPQKQ